MKNRSESLFLRIPKPLISAETHAWADPAAAAVLACAPEDASVPRPPPHQQLPQRIRFVSGQRTILLRRGGGAGLPDNFGLLPRSVGQRIRTRFRTGDGGRDLRAPWPARLHPDESPLRKPQLAPQGCVRFPGRGVTPRRVFPERAASETLRLRSASARDAARRGFPRRPRVPGGPSLPFGWRWPRSPPVPPTPGSPYPVAPPCAGRTPCGRLCPG